MIEVNTTVAKICLTITLVALLGVCVFEAGVHYQKDKFAKIQEKANVIVTTKNTEVKDIAATQEKIQIEYKDRIVIKYQTVEKEIVKYVQTKDAAGDLDREFVRLHDFAAADSKVETPESAGISDSTDSGTEVTKGQAISVIADNYKQYYECKATVEGWQEFYSKIQSTVNQ